MVGPSWATSGRPDHRPRAASDRCGDVRRTQNRRCVRRQLPAKSQTANWSARDSATRAAGCAPSGRRPSSRRPRRRGRPTGRGRGRPGRRRGRGSACRAGARRRASQAGATSSPRTPAATVSACSGCQAARSSIVRRTPARMPASGSSSSIGASRAVRDDRARVEQRAVGVRAVGLAGPEAVGEVAVGRRVRELHRAGDAERREAGEILGREQLRVLDPVAQPERLPDRPRLLERVERLAVRAVADRVHRDREARPRRRARTISASSSPLVIRTPRAVEHQRRLRAERPVHERLQVAEPQQRAAEARSAMPSGAQRRRPGRAGPTARRAASARRARSRRCQSRSAPSQPSLSCTAVTPRAAASFSPARIAST